MEFIQGATATVTMSFDVWAHHLPMLEVYGTEGSIECPDPNTFGGEVRVWTKKKRHGRRFRSPIATRPGAASAWPT